jgi:hypothetical protein
LPNNIALGIKHIAIGMLMPMAMILVAVIVVIVNDIIGPLATADDHQEKDCNKVLHNVSIALEHLNVKLFSQETINIKIADCPN